LQPQGGVRVPTILSGGLLPAALRGTQHAALFHVSDWLPTLLHAINGGAVAPLADSLSLEIPYDGVDQFEQLMGRNSTDARSEVVLDHCQQGFGHTQTGCNHFCTVPEGKGNAHGCGT